VLSGDLIFFFSISFATVLEHIRPQSAYRKPVVPENESHRNLPGIDWAQSNLSVEQREHQGAMQ
jgi:hypothetical protein